MLKIGLIGAGFMGATHAKCYELLSKDYDIQITAIADLSLEKIEKISKNFKPEMFSTGIDLISSADVDVIDICLPTNLHASHAILAMQKGYDIFIEKPVCLNMQEALHLLQVQKETNAKVAVGHCIRFWNEYKYLKEIIDNNKLGNLCNISLKRVSPKPSWSWDNWLLDETRSGGAVLDLHIHDVDFAGYILGYPNKIHAKISGQDKRNDHIYSIFEYDNTLVSLEGGWDYPLVFPFEMSYQAIFEKGCITFSSCRNKTIHVYENNGLSYFPEFEQSIEKSDEETGGNISSLGGYYNELKYFVECILNDEEIKIAPLKDAVESLKLTLNEIEISKIKN